MRNNLPSDDFGFDATSPVQDNGLTITKEMLELARIGNSPNWKVIKTYVEGRVEAYKKGLFGENLEGKSTDIIGQRFLAATSVIHELESLVAEVEKVTESVNDVTKG